ncbi:MAG: DUF2818 family protein [Thiofilum sp.]|uniref:DUF2818 family protein n=1 Tax=Thiofilum sp. TaxID=2212733 RepID=UPI0025DF21AB|nr:DUF2818 family protein [Thiofilum sp.]MBK8455290.1 DUF2818 family protein [Thiofilum sp.]
MTTLSYQIAFLVLAGVLANLPWLNQRCFFILECETKYVWVRLFEWLVLYLVVGVLAYALERRIMGVGNVHSQDWEFYAITFFVFAVFALPGFIYRHIR